jgi:hypothetical protein
MSSIRDDREKHGPMEEFHSTRLKVNGSQDMKRLDEDLTVCPPGEPRLRSCIFGLRISSVCNYLYTSSIAGSCWSYMSDQASQTRRLGFHVYV